MSEYGDRIKKRMELGSQAIEDILSSGLGDVRSDSPMIVHHGVKGMHWGIRKEEDTGGDSGGATTSGTADSWKKAIEKPKTISDSEAKAHLAQNEKKLQDKFDDSDESSGPGFISRHKKGLIIAGVGAAAIGALYLNNKAWNARNLESIEKFSGKAISPDGFAQHVQYSKLKTWTGRGYVQQHSFDRPGFTLPAGHEFHRISRVAETKFKPATYATHHVDDYNRYLAQFRQELGSSNLHHVTFHATQEIKVPDLSTVLNSLKEVMHDNPHGTTYSDRQILKIYEQYSGGRWNDATSEKLFNNLRSKGFGAIVDEMDSGVLGESPLVVFAHEVMGQKSSVPITPDMIAEAESKLIELANRKT